MSGKENEELEEALGALEQLDPQEGPQDESADAGLEREYRELAGLLAYEVEPANLSPELRARVLSAATAGAESVALEAPQPAYAARNVVAFSRPEAETAGSSAWQQMAVAAGVVLSLSLAALSGYLFSQVRSQQATLEDLQAQLAAQPAVDFAELQTVKRQLEKMENNYRLVTNPAAEVCPLRPRGDAPEQPNARGMLWVDRTQNRWVLSASNLEVCELGRQYQVWFVAADGTIKGDMFGVKGPEQLIQIEADELPPGTTAVMITLEPAEGVAEPTGPVILYGDEPMESL